MNRAKHKLRMCFEPGYPDKYKAFKEVASNTRSGSFDLFWTGLPVLVAIVNIPAGLYRSPILLLYGVLFWVFLLLVSCEARVAAKRRSMLE
jgi:hypothetical protein